MLRLSTLVLVFLISVITSGCQSSDSEDSSSGSLSVTLSSSSINFNANINSGDPTPQVITASYSGYSLVVGYPPGVSEPSWLSVYDSGSSGSTVDITFAANTSFLSTGTYSTTVRFFTTDIAQTEYGYKDVTITLKVTDGIATDLTQLNFSTTLASTQAPATQAVSILGNSVNWNATSDKSWIQLGATSGTSPSTLSVSVDAGALAVGSYSGTITLTDTDKGQSVTVSVTLQVQAPAFTVLPHALTFSGVNGKALGSQDISVSVSNGATTTWSATTNATWLVLNGGGQSATGTTPGTLTVGIDAEGAALASGSHSATITLSGSVNGYNLSKDIAVDLNLYKMSFTTQPYSKSFSGVNGSNLGSQSASFALDVDSYSHPWTAHSNASWLLLDGGSDSSGFDNGTLNLTVDSSGMSSGSYSTTVDLTAQVNGDVLSTSFNVSLSLTPATLSSDVGNLLISGINGTALGSHGVVLSLDTGAVAHNWSATIDTGGSGNWLNVDSLSGTTDGNGTNLTFSTDMTGMLGGVYNADVNFVATINGDTINYTLPVSVELEPHRLFVADNGIALTAFPSATGVLSNSFTVEENAGVTTAWSASSDQSWLTLNSGSGNSGDSITVTADSTGLAAGMHYATVTISSSDTTIENSEQVTVGLYVAASNPSMSGWTVTLSDPSKLTGMVADPVRPYVYISHGGTTIEAYDVHDASHAFTIAAVGGDIRYLSISSDGSTLYAVDHANQAIVPVSLNQDADMTSTSASVGSAWSGINWISCFSCSATQWYLFNIDYARPNGHGVVLSSGLEMLDATDGHLIATFDGTNSFSRAPLINTTLRGNELIAVSRYGTPADTLRYSISYSHLNGGTGQVVQTHKLWNLAGSTDLALAPDSSEFYSTALDIYATADLTVQGALPSATTYVANAIAVADDGTIFTGHAYVTGFDIQAFDGVSHALLGSYTITGDIDDRELSLSGDGLRIIARSNSRTTLTFLDR